MADTAGAAGAQQWRVLRVFISSTFRDTHSERDLITRRIFPRLRELCAARQVMIYEGDLRWGVTSEESATGQATRICLEEIDRSNIFVCLVGSRYGWTPDDYGVPEDPAFDWVRRRARESARALREGERERQRTTAREGRERAANRARMGEGGGASFVILRGSTERGGELANTKYEVMSRGPVSFILSDPSFSLSFPSLPLSSPGPVQVRDYTEGRSITELEIQRGCLNPGATRAPKCERSIFCFRDDAFLEQVSEERERLERGMVGSVCVCCVRSLLSSVSGTTHF